MITSTMIIPTMIISTMITGAMITGAMISRALVVPLGFVVLPPGWSGHGTPQAAP